MGAQKNCLIETVLSSTHNICFGWGIRKIIFNYTLLSGGLTLYIYFHLVIGRISKNPVNFIELILRWIHKWSFLDSSCIIQHSYIPTSVFPFTSLAWGYFDLRTSNSSSDVGLCQTTLSPQNTRLSLSKCGEFCKKSTKGCVYFIFFCFKNNWVNPWASTCIAKIHIYIKHHITCVAPITQLPTCIIKIVTFKGGH